MTPSAWKCPDCKHALYVTHAARYWCSECSKEQDAERVDPMCRDYVRMSILFDGVIERQLEVSFER